MQLILKNACRAFKLSALKNILGVIPVHEEHRQRFLAAGDDMQKSPKWLYLGLT